MDNRVKSTTARLRRTFHYPTDDDTSSNVTPEVLDEEEQEALIHSLVEQNSATNHQFQILLSALPILASIPYILALFHPATTLIALLGLTSLASTAFLLFSLPIASTGIPALDAWARSSSSSTTRARSSTSEFDNDDVDDNGDSARWNAVAAATVGGSSNPSGLGALNQMRQRRRSSATTYTAPRSPLERYLPLLNIGLCTILVLSGLIATTHNSSSGEGGGKHDGNAQQPGKSLSDQYGWLGLGNIPAVVYVGVLLAKYFMAGIDPESELSALKYPYKGV
ncbi:hypothetical protein BD289DRAFT_441036 [Coniella lustricola]|uniref:Uncharacterized protein n=1 Tax=Coniella lustricola TaxID=2025994 RepID=A0A2T2ZZW0_9PEZI|nr:hypothetical protein BD289DRAFT_441036 [Coniella lustricola]